MTNDLKTAYLAGVSITALALVFTIYPSGAQACEATRQPSEGPISSIAVVCDTAETEVIDTDYPSFLFRQLGSEYNGDGADTFTVTGDVRIQQNDNVEGEPFSAFTIDMGAGVDNFTMKGGSFLAQDLNPGDAPIVELLMGAGNDTVDIGAGTFGGNIFGGADDDTINVSGGLVDGSIFGDDAESIGNDTITVSGGRIAGSIFAGGGDDTVTVSGTAQIGVAGEGPDSVGLEDGNDIFRMTGGTLAGSVSGNTGDDTLTISGGRVTTFVAGNEGADTIDISGTAFIGAHVTAGEDNDTVTIRGGTVTTFVDGGGGDDRIAVSGGSIGGDVYGNDGNDIINVSGGTIAGSVFGGAGTDAVTISGGSIAGGVEGETVTLRGGTIGGDITGISGDTLNIQNAGTNLNLRDGVLFQGVNAVGNITGTDLARASGNTFRSQNFDGFSSLSVSSSTIGFTGSQTIGDLALSNGSTLYVAGQVTLLPPPAGEFALFAALPAGSGNLSAVNSTISMINNDPTDRFNVGNLTLNGATLGIDINQRGGLGDRFVTAGQFEATGRNVILVNLLGTPVFTGVSIIPIAPIAGEAVPTAGIGSTIFSVAGIPNTPGSLFAYDVITGADGGIYLRALPSDLVSPQATRVAIDSQPIETVTEAIAQITDDALAFALGFPKGSGRSDAAPGFGVYASGQLATVSHDGFSISDGISTLQGPSFTANDFSLAGSVELDLAKYYGFDQTYGLNVGVYGGYASSDVKMDPVQGFQSVGSADNKSGMFGAYGLFRTGMTYGLVSATTFIGQTDINNDVLNSTGGYDTVGYALTGSVGHIFPLGDKWKFDLRGGALWASFEGDAFTDSQGNEFGKSRVSFGALKFEPGFYGDFALDNGMAISPYARLELQQRIGYHNSSSIAGMDFEFDDADFSAAVSTGLNVQLSKMTTLSGEIKTKFSSDSQSLAGKIGLKAKF